MKRVTLIGPVGPFRGGIARHAEAVARALSARSDVALEVESFKRLYPRWLYPGESDRDAARSGDLPFPVRYSIDTLNPISWFPPGARITTGDLVVIPAWTFFVAPMLGTIARCARRRGATVVMIVHNAADHDGSAWKVRLSNWQLRAADAFLTHSDQLAEQLRQSGHFQPTVVIAHPAYRDFPEAKGTLPRERALELLCFGLVRPYKGVELAIRALARSGLHDVRLTIAGEIWEGRGALFRMVESLGLADKVEFIDRYVRDEEAAELFARCDAVLAPYRTVTGSGVVALARHYRKAVIASDLPGLSEVVVHGRTGWLFPREDETALSQLLRVAVTRKSASAISDSLAKAPPDDEWDGMARAIVGFSTS